MEGIQRLDMNRRDIAEEVWGLQHRAYLVEAREIGAAGLPPLNDTVESLQRCGELFYGDYTSGGDLAGAISYREDNGKGEVCVICRLMVDPDKLRQGIGTRLVEYVLNERPHGTVWQVTAESRNSPAIALYESRGFVGQGTFQPVAGVSMIRFVRLPS